MENGVTADYLDEDGCLHCGICGKRKQMKVSRTSGKKILGMEI